MEQGAVRDDKKPPDWCLDAAIWQSMVMHETVSWCIEPKSRFQACPQVEERKSLAPLSRHLSRRETEHKSVASQPLRSCRNNNKSKELVVFDPYAQARNRILVEHGAAAAARFPLCDPRSIGLVVWDDVKESAWDPPLWHWDLPFLHWGSPRRHWDPPWQRHVDYFWLDWLHKTAPSTWRAPKEIEIEPIPMPGDDSDAMPF